MKRPSFQLYPKDFLIDRKVVVLSNEQLGGYFKLVCHMWMEDDCTLPDDDKELMSLSGLNELDFKKVKKLFIANGSPSDPKLSHKRLNEERAKQDEHRKKRSEAGRKGNEARWGSQKTPSSQCDPNGIAKNRFPSSSPSIVNNPLPPKGGAVENQKDSEIRKMLMKWLKSMPDVNNPASMAKWYIDKWGIEIVGKALKNSNCTSRSKLTELCDGYKNKKK